jgi:hypothetical protein
MTTKLPRILFCNCTYAQVVPKEVKETLLRRLCESGLAFDAVADLCEMSARQDPGLKRLADSGALKIAACYPRAVKWLFNAAKAPLSPAATEVLNMRLQNTEEIWKSLLCPVIQPNLTASNASPAPATPEAKSPVLPTVSPANSAASSTVAPLTSP